jgi:hypothetical protein
VEKSKYSERAKSGTRKQINGIIEFLEKQVLNQNKELKKYQSLIKLSFSKIALNATNQNMTKTKLALKSYQAIKKDYLKKGLI